MASVNETNYDRIEDAFEHLLAKREYPQRPQVSPSESDVVGLLESIIEDLPAQGKFRVVVTSLAWFALDTLYQSETGHLPTVSLRKENLSAYLVFGRIYKCKPVLKDLTWGFAHHVANVMLTGNKMAEIGSVSAIEEYTEYSNRNRLVEDLPHKSKIAGDKIAAILFRMAFRSAQNRLTLSG